MHKVLAIVCAVIVAALAISPLSAPVPAQADPTLEVGPTAQTLGQPISQRAPWLTVVVRGAPAAYTLLAGGCRFDEVNNRVARATYTCHPRIFQDFTPGAGTATLLDPVTHAVLATAAYSVVQQTPASAYEIYARGHDVYSQAGAVMNGARLGKLADALARAKTMESQSDTTMAFEGFVLEYSVDEANCDFAAAVDTAKRRMAWHRRGGVKDINDSDYAVLVRALWRSGRTQEAQATLVRAIRAVPTSSALNDLALTIQSPAPACTPYAPAAGVRH
jgi:hypothetical protein